MTDKPKCLMCGRGNPPARKPDEVPLDPVHLLVPRQVRVLAALYLFVDRHGLEPTIKEMSAMTGVSQPTLIRVALNVLEQKGWLERERAKRGAAVATRRARRVRFIPFESKYWDKCLRDMENKVPEVARKGALTLRRVKETDR